jgi:hypothetical protein
MDAMNQKRPDQKYSNSMSGIDGPKKDEIT